MPYPEKAADAALLATHQGALGDAAYYQRPSGIDVILYRANGSDIPSIVECPRATKAGNPDKATQLLAGVSREIETQSVGPNEARSRAIGRSLELMVTRQGLDNESASQAFRVSEAVKPATATQPIQPIEHGPFMAGFEAQSFAAGRNGTYIGFEHASGLRAVAVIPLEGDVRVVALSRETWDTLDVLTAEAVRVDESPIQPGPPPMSRDVDFLERSRFQSFIDGVRNGQEIFDQLRIDPTATRSVSSESPPSIQTLGS